MRNPKVDALYHRGHQRRRSAENSAEDLGNAILAAATVVSPMTVRAGRIGFIFAGTGPGRPVVLGPLAAQALRSRGEDATAPIRRASRRRG
jgi:hypothetical protein